MTTSATTSVTPSATATAVPLTAATGPHPSPFRLDGARALVTGASRGIGLAVATALAGAGADIALAARTREALGDAEGRVLAAGGRAVLTCGDLAEPGAAGRLVDEAARALGGLDIVVHNAGVIPTDDDGASRLVPFPHSTPRDWEQVLDVNVGGTVGVCRAAYRHLAASPRACVVVVSSVAGLMATPAMEAYALSKAAQISLVRSLALSWARDGIRVNALCPGWVRTDMTEPMQRHAPLSDWLMSHVPQGRWLLPEEVASAALFLASPAASAVTGHALVCDAGVSVPDGGLTGTPKPPSPFAG